MGEIEKPIFRDIRRYFCEYCGICRSKKSLITSHILTHHKELMEEKGVDEEEKIEGTKSNTCTECGSTFKKLAYLKQHMQSHSLERPYTCPVDDCHSSYRRKDHLTRHLLLHQGKLFNCPIENCNREFSFHGNMKRHVKEFHGEDQPLTDAKCQKQYVCPEIGCGKAFRFASKLRKHEDSHVKLDSVEAFCCEPGCMKYFSNDQCLKAHIKSCHQHITCEICGTKQVKRNIKRHLQMHEAKVSLVRIKCNHKGCLHTFSNPLVDQKSSRRVASRFQKIQALHLRSFHQIMGNEQVRTSQNVSILNQMKESIDGTEEETVETCNGKIFLNCVLDDSQNLSDYDDLADFIECKQGKDYNGWLKDRQRYRNWRSQKLAVLRWKKKIKTLKLIRKK